MYLSRGTSMYSRRSPARAGVRGRSGHPGKPRGVGAPMWARQAPGAASRAARERAIKIVY